MADQTLGDRRIQKDLEGRMHEGINEGMSALFSLWRPILTLQSVLLQAMTDSTMAFAGNLTQQQYQNHQNQQSPQQHRSA